MRNPYLVKFFHCGAERIIKNNEISQGICKWKYKTGHARKYVITQGEYISKIGNKPQIGDIGFWCEWEAQSLVKRISFVNNNNDESNNKYPVNYHIPILPSKSMKPGYLNTDPCVIGKHFLYCNCKQNTKKGNPTHMQNLNIGDIVVFGSAFGNTKIKNFVCDTVFVVGEKIKFNRKNVNSQIGSLVPRWYYNLTINLLSSNEEFTLYVGATYNNPINGMFSFIPCINITNTPMGFIRPNVLQNLNSGQTQGTARIKSLNSKQLWSQIVNEVIKQGLLLGISATSNTFYQRKIHIKKPKKIISKRYSKI